MTHLVRVAAGQVHPKRLERPVLEQAIEVLQRHSHLTELSRRPRCCSDLRDSARAVAQSRWKFLQKIQPKRANAAMAAAIKAATTSANLAHFGGVAILVAAR